MLSLGSAKSLVLDKSTLSQKENQTVTCTDTILEDDDEKCKKQLEEAVKITSGKSVFFSHEMPSDLFFTYPLTIPPNFIVEPLKVRIQGNLPRHFGLKLYLRDVETREITEVTSNLEVYR